MISRGGISPPINREFSELPLNPSGFRVNGEPKAPYWGWDRRSLSEGAEPPIVESPPISVRD